MSERARASARETVGSGPSVLKSIPRQRVGDRATRRGIRGWASSVWKTYLGLAAEADPCLTTVWIHGQCLDVSIYDRDWPESYRY